VRNHLTKSLGTECNHMRLVPTCGRLHKKPNIGRWPEACYKHWKAIQPPISISCVLGMGRGCFMSTIMKHRRRGRGRK
jgi:hypothetical protein